MLIHLDQSNPTPMYEQIVQQIKEQILSGDLVPGKELPSIRQLAAQLVTSVITTKRAYQELEAAGLIITRPGVGSVVAVIPETVRSNLRLQEIKSGFNDVVANARRLGVSDKTTRQLFYEVMFESEDAGDE